jgi:ACS family hexuronate transporter-like MFS transporter
MPVMNASGVPFLHGRRGVVAAVALSGGALMMGSYATLSLAPIAPLIRADLGISRAGIGLLTAAIFLGAALASTPAGHLTDRLGAARLLVLAMLGVGTAEFVAALSPVVWLFVIAVFGVGLAYGCITPPTNVIVRGAADDANRGLIMSSKQIGVTLGGLIAGLTLPLIADAYGWRTALFAPAAAAFVIAALAFLTRANLRRQTGPVAHTALRAQRLIVRLPWRLGVGGFGFLMAGLQLSFVSYLAVFLTEQHGYRLGIAGISLAVTMLGGTIGRLGWAVVSDRWFSGRRGAGLALTAGIAAVGLVGLAVLPTGPLLWPCVALVGLSSIGWNGVFLTLVAESVPPSHVGRMSGWALRSVFTGVVVIPPVIGLIADRADWSVTWLVAAALTTVAGVGILLGSRGGVNPRSAEGLTPPG